MFIGLDFVQRKSLAKIFMHPLLPAMDNSVWSLFILPLKNYVAALLAANFSKIVFFSPILFSDTMPFDLCGFENLALLNFYNSRKYLCATYLQ